MKESDDMNLGIETETLEFKRSTGELKEAVHSICAILNKHQCGELYFGVKTDGTGLRRIANACDNAGVRYEFQKKKTGFVVCFYRHTNEKNEDKLIKTDKKPIRNERYTKIIEYIKERGSISNKETRELLGIADSTAKRLLKKMVEDKILIGKGERKARKYLLR